MKPSSISLDGVMWELRTPNQVHYSTRREGGRLFLHANRECSRLTEPTVELSPKIVKTLWEKDAVDSTTKDENDVQWCEDCATQKVSQA